MSNPVVGANSNYIITSTFPHELTSGSTIVISLPNSILATTSTTCTFSLTVVSAITYTCTLKQENSNEMSLVINNSVPANSNVIITLTNLSNPPSM